MRPRAPGDAVRPFQNGLYKLSAFLIACVLWAAAQGVRSVEESLDVPISIAELPADVVVVDQSAREVNVRVSARSPSSVAFRLDARTTKQVAVRVDLAGEPDPGFRVRAVRAVPAQVTLEGASGELKKIQELSTDRVDVSGLSASEARPARLIIAANNVWRADGTTPVRVEIDIEAAEQSEPQPAAQPAQDL